jgi:hypothetical protein
MRGLLVFVVAAAMAPLALAKGPWAQIDGRSANHAHADEVDVRVQQVDGKRYQPPVDEVKLAPGPHWVTLVTTRPTARPLNFSGTGLTTTRTTYQPWVMKAEPCMRYRVAAQHDGPSTERWTVELVAVERIGDCTPPAAAPEASPPAATPAPAPPAAAGAPSSR